MTQVTKPLAIEDKLKQATDNSEIVRILNDTISKAMDKDRTLQEYGDGHFALGYLRSWLIKLLKEENRID